ncbi:gamma-butyrobetaine dioxygenase-like [Pieris napi]|uniref:gamma-butyrobetaine dioxygenase-like n=1 Tax=Pieris napi TaxID=78633 RepID=UPI001FBB8DBA|nr:gamma-butyrobetaine dioxygenase-like [Pieris napi]
MFVLRQVQSANSTVKVFFKNITKRCTHNFIQLEVDGENLKFPHIWLRDNCQCNQCFHSTAKSRIIDYSNLKIDVKPKSINKDENSLHVTWDDGHTSQFRIEWLKFRSFTQENQSKYYESIYKPRRKRWNGSEFFQVCSKHNYNEILQSDKALFQWLHNISVYGIALIQNSPNKEDALDEIISRIGFSKETHYGEKFTVQNVQNTSNVAYLSNKLQLHTDLPYYEYCPGVNMLHCLVQTKSQGGENLLSDAHYTAMYMKDNYPEQYKLLTGIEVEWSDIGTENEKQFFKLYRSPIIVVDSNEDIIRINFSIPQRGSILSCPVESVTPWYEAHKLFFDLNHKFAAKFKTQEGDILVFDNIRLLHGRNKYEDRTNNSRKLIGAYVDWDEIYSTWRCLKVKLYPHNGYI